MPETTLRLDHGQRRAPFASLLSLLIIPSAVISVSAMLPPSASGQYVFFFAMLFSAVLIPLGAVALILALIALLRTNTHPIYRAVLVGYILFLAGAALTMSGYHYGPGP